MKTSKSTFFISLSKLTVFGYSFISVTLKVILKVSFCQHFFVFIQYFTELSLMFSYSISHLMWIILLFKWGLYFSVCYLFPRKISHPSMLFELVDSTPTKPFHWFPLQKLVRKICTFNTPIFRNLIFSDNNLLC